MPFRDRALTPAATAATIAALGFVVGLAGDACHVASGTTRYEWGGVPTRLYALTAVVRGEPATVSVVLTGALAIAVWSWWDPSPGTLAVAAGAAVAGPLTEIVLVALGAASYADDADGLGGVAPWLPCLYFAAGAVAAGLWRAIARDGR